MKMVLGWEQSRCGFEVRVPLPQLKGRDCEHTVCPQSQGDFGELRVTAGRLKPLSKRQLCPSKILAELNQVEMSIRRARRRLV
jgi:hypothetical protein